MKSFLSAIIFFLIGSAAYAQMSFSDQDLERYKTKSDSQPVEQRNEETSPSYSSGQGGGAVISRGRSGVYNGDYSTTTDDRDVWCQRGEQARAEIDKAESRAAIARENYETIYNRYRVNTRSGFNEMTYAKNGMQQAQTSVDQARRALDRLENEAHRKGVHPGWLKCNFN